MGIQAGGFTVAVILAAACQGAAALLLSTGRPRTAFVSQFAAGFLVLKAAEDARLPWMMGLAGLQGALLLGVTLLRAPPGRGAAALAVLAMAAGGAGLVEGTARLNGPGRAPPPLVAEVWDPGFPLRVRRPPVALRPLPLRGRIFTHGGAVRLDWPAGAGPVDAEVLLENAGPPGRMRLLQGPATLTHTETSRLRVRCRFPYEGGTVRLQARPWRGPTRLLVLHGCGGDPACVARLLERLADAAPDVVVLLGGIGPGGDYGAHLAIRNLVDALGAVTVAVPEGADLRGAGGRVWRSVWGPPAGLRQAGGMAALVLDPTRPGGLEAALEGLGFQARMGAHLGRVVAFPGPALLAPPGRSRDLEPETGVRERVLSKLGDWGVALLVGTVPGPGYMVARDGLQQVAVSRGGPEPEACLLRLTAEAGRPAVMEERVRVLRPQGILADADRVRRRVVALAGEHPELGRLLALSGAALAGGLLGGAGILARRRRRRNAAPTSSSPRAPCGDAGAGSTS